MLGVPVLCPCITNSVHPKGTYCSAAFSSTRIPYMTAGTLRRIVKGRVSSSRTQSVQRFVPDFLGGIFIETQGELRLYIPAIFRYFHGDMQEYVGLFRMFASFTAYDDTSVYGCTRFSIMVQSEWIYRYASSSVNRPDLRSATK